MEGDVNCRITWLPTHKADAQYPHSLLGPRDERASGNSAAKRDNNFSPPDLDCHATLPRGSCKRRGRYHTWTCCAAGFQTGLCRLGVKPGSRRVGAYVSFRRLRTLRLARRVFGARLTRQPRLLRRKGDRPSATASPAPQTICRPEPQGIPRSSRPAAMARNDIAPPACSSLTTGASAAHSAARVCLTATEALISEDRLSAEQEPGKLRRHGMINGIILWNSICSRRFRKASRR